MKISNPNVESLIQSYNPQKDVTRKTSLQDDLNSFEDVLKSQLSDFTTDQASSIVNLLGINQTTNSLNQFLLFSLMKSKLLESSSGDINLAKANNSITYSKQAQIYSPSKACNTNTASGNYHEIFSGDVFLGDSITKGLSAYGVLDDSKVYAKVGAGTKKVEEMVDSASKQDPKRVFIMSGINDVGSYNKAQFAQHYTDLIRNVKARCPNAKVYVQSILPVLDQASHGNPNLNNNRISQFNSVLSQISQQENVSFLDTSALVSHNKDLYASDGVHYKQSFYPLWLNFLQTYAK